MRGTDGIVEGIPTSDPKVVGSIKPWSFANGFFHSKVKYLFTVKDCEEPGMYWNQKFEDI